MKTMNKVSNGTLSCHRYETPVNGLSLGILGLADLCCLEERDGELFLLINDEGIAKAGVKVVHTDGNWGL